MPRPRRQFSDGLGSGKLLLEGGRQLVLILGGDESAPAAADIEQAESYLCYTGGRALYYVPMWCFVIDEGERENTADGLHSYRPYYVPAVSLDTLGTLLAD